MADEKTGKTAAKAPDNNKRLAQLEAGVASLAIALVAAGITIEEGADPIVVAITTLGRSAEEANDGVVEALKARVAELEDAAAKGPDGATEGEIAAVARAEKAEALLEAARVQLDEQRKEIDELLTDVEELHAKVAASAAGESAAEPTPEPRERPASARDFGPTYGGIDAAELAQRIDAGCNFEISFSNGDHEIIELAPVAVTAAELVSKGGRYQVAPPVFVRAGEHAERIHGAALVCADTGEQIDYCEFPAPVAIAPRQERRFERSLTFG